jgi:glutaredoxin-like protein NrdH
MTTEKKPAPLIVYSADWCGDCQLLKAFLQEHQIPYENRDIRKEPQWGEELEAKTGKLGVPYLKIGDEWIIGYEAGVGYNEAYAKTVLADYLPGPTS